MACKRGCRLPNPCLTFELFTPSGVQVVKEAYPDDTQFDPGSEYFDPKATRDNPRWHRVRIRLVLCCAVLTLLPFLPPAFAWQTHWLAYALWEWGGGPHSGPQNRV
jgi:hypothetical protein